MFRYKFDGMGGGVVVYSYCLLHGKKKLGPKAFPLSKKGAVLSMPIEQTVESIEIVLKVVYSLVHVGGEWGLLMGKSEGSFGLSVRWDVAFVDDHVILEQSGRPKEKGTPKSKGNVVVVAGTELGQSGRAAKKPFVVLEVTLAPVKEESGIKVGVGIPGTPFSISGTTGSKSKPWKFPLKVAFDVRPKEEPAKPKSPKKTLIIYTIGPFVTGKADASKLDKKAKGFSRMFMSYQEFQRAIDELPSRTIEMLRNGDKPGGRTVRIDGYADSRDTFEFNKNLSAARAEDVAKRFMKWTGAKNNVVSTKGAGEPKLRPAKDGKEPKGYDNPNLRKVTFEIMIEH